MTASQGGVGRARRSPFEVAIEVLRTRYPDSLLAFVAGSFNRGEETLFSDIDLVVIFGRLDHASRESFVFGDWPIEAFLHDPETLRYFFYEMDAKSGIPMLPAMVAERLAIPEGHATATELKALAHTVLGRLPTPWDVFTLSQKRYRITDMVDDLRDPRNDIEAAATIGILHEELGNFYFRARGMWSASKKHIPRRLAAIDPRLASRWSEAFIQAWSGRRENLILLAEEIVVPYGGLLFDGYRLDAPAAWRTP